jgi:hypothetical protein
MIEAMGMHDPNAILAFVTRQGPERYGPLAQAATTLHGHAMRFLTTDVEQFLDYKTPALAPAIPADRLKICITAAIESDDQTLSAILEPLTLDELYALASFSNRLQFAITQLQKNGANPVLK